MKPERMLLRAADNGEDFAVEACEIAGIEPALGIDHRRSPLGGSIIAAHDIGSPDVQFADLARCHNAAVRPDKPRLNASDQRADCVIVTRRVAADARDAGRTLVMP